AAAKAVAQTCDLLHRRLAAGFTECESLSVEEGESRALGGCEPKGIPVVVSSCAQPKCFRNGSHPGETWRGGTKNSIDAGLVSRDYHRSREGSWARSEI